VAEQERLRNLVTILTERPTLQRLVQSAAWTELPPFLAAFQTQSQVDLLLFCDQAGARGWQHCTGPLSSRRFTPI